MHAYIKTLHAGAGRRRQSVVELPPLLLPCKSLGRPFLGAGSGSAMRYVVTDDFVAAHGWTPDATAKALAEPLARIGVLVERARGFGHGGFQSPELPLQAFNLKKADVLQIVKRVLDGGPPARPIG